MSENAKTTITLTEFLLARIAEDEAKARAANGPRWAPGDGDVSEGGLYAYSPGSTDDRDCWSIAWFELGETNPGQRISGQDWRRSAHENSVHAARHDPARVLAECEAKRRIVEHCDFEHLALSPGDPYVLQLLALPYADHADYREEWRP